MADATDPCNLYLVVDDAGGLRPATVYGPCNYKNSASPNGAFLPAGQSMAFTVNTLFYGHPPYSQVPPGGTRVEHVGPATWAVGIKGPRVRI